MLEEKKKLPVPCVYLGNAPENTKYSYVITDSIRGGYLAGRTLIEKGYKKIGFIGGTDGGSSVDERYKGFVNAMERYNITLNEKYIRLENWRRKTGYEIMEQMINSGDYPDAVAAGNDFLALGIIQKIREKGLRIPEDIAVIGFDDIPNASWPEINLSTIRQPKIHMGESAVELLVGQIKEKHGEIEEPSGPVRIILDPELILRGTC